MKTVLKVVGVLLGLVVLGAGGFFLWAKSAVTDKLSQTYEVHSMDFPIPFPLSEEEMAALRAERTAALAPGAPSDGEAAQDGAAKQPADEGEPEAQDVLAGVDLEAIALERAIARGEHLVNSRYVCVECHGRDFSGGVMIDDPAIGTILGPNITSGRGGKTANYKAADWDRIVRHGVKPDGHPAAMPSEDFQLMSDQELSDVIAYVQSKPPRDNEVPGLSLGPVGTILMATGRLPLSADLIHDHDVEHARLPPQTEATANFGKHLAGVCTGCHRATLEGGPIAAGDPSWPPAQNLTPHADGLEGWSFEQFEALMRTGKRPDGTGVQLPMTLMTPYTSQMTDVEMKALWAYISGLPAKPTGQ